MRRSGAVQALDSRVRARDPVSVTVPTTLSFREGDRAVLADGRYFPILWVTWWGEPNEALIRRYFEWNDAMILRAMAERVKFAHITDARQTGFPPPTVRKLVAELTEASPLEASDLNLGTFLVHESALLRGAVTAIQWLSKRDFKVVPIPDLRGGVVRALEALAKANIARPPGLDPEGCIAPSMPDAT